MARSRMLKPGFFKNETLTECTPFARLLFAGLWTLCDREGRMEYRPKRIKAEIFPYDNVDVESCIEELQSRGFLTLYTAKHGQNNVLQCTFLSLPSFVTHQHPHPKEPPSEIPPPPKGTASPSKQPSLPQVENPQDVTEKPCKDTAKQWQNNGAPQAKQSESESIPSCNAASSGQQPRKPSAPPPTPRRDDDDPDAADLRQDLAEVNILGRNADKILDAYEDRDAIRDAIRSIQAKVKREETVTNPYGLLRRILDDGDAAPLEPKKPKFKNGHDEMMARSTGIAKAQGEEIARGEAMYAAMTPEERKKYDDEWREMIGIAKRQRPVPLPQNKGPRLEDLPKPPPGFMNQEALDNIDRLSRNRHSLKLVQPPTTDTPENEQKGRATPSEGVG